jgi:hypothetical protein
VFNIEPPRNVTIAQAEPGAPAHAGARQALNGCADAARTGRCALSQPRPRAAVSLRALRVAARNGLLSDRWLAVSGKRSTSSTVSPLAWCRWSKSASSASSAHW